jgi:tryptophanyl-tRNA synthetase
LAAWKIGLLDDENLIKKKVASAVTDSLREVRCDPGRPGVFNLIAIYSQLAGIKPQEVEVKYSGMGYSEFKADLAELVLSTLRPLQKRYMEIRPSGELEKVMSSSAEQAREISRKRLVRS